MIERAKQYESELGRTPTGWSVKPLGEISTKITKGASPKWQGYTYQDSGMLFVTSENVRDGFLDVSAPKYLPMEFHSKLKNSQLRRGDILLNIVGASIGRACVYLLENTNANINQAVSLVRLNQENDPIYITNYLLLPGTMRRLIGTQGETARPNLSLENIRKFKVVLPPLAEQRKIAAILSAWDQAIALTEQLIDALKRRKHALMQLLLTGTVRFPEFAGEAWEKIMLGEAAQVNAELLGESTSPDYEFHYVDLSAVKMGTVVIPTERTRFKDAPSRARRVLHTGDIIMATVRPNLQGFALCDFDTTDMICSTGFAVLTLNDRQDSDFLYQNLYSESMGKQIQDLVTGSNYPAINATEVARLRVPYPVNARERMMIGSFLRACDDEIQIHLTRTEQLVKQKRGLMQQLLTGAVRVQTVEETA